MCPWPQDGPKGVRDLSQDVSRMDLASSGTLSKGVRHGSETGSRLLPRGRRQTWEWRKAARYQQSIEVAQLLKKLYHTFGSRLVVGWLGGKNLFDARL
jgi:hypothetical protein